MKFKPVSSQFVSVMYDTRNQMQTGIRQNRKRLFEQEIRRQVVRYARYRITRQKSLSLPLVITRNQICRQNRQGLGRIKNRTKGRRVQYFNRLAYKKWAQNKDQRSDGLTYKLLGVEVHRNIKQAKRILGSEDGLNNYYGEGTQGFIKQSKDIGKTWTRITHNAYKDKTATY